MEKERPFDLIEKFETLHKILGFEKHDCITYNEENVEKFLKTDEFLEIHRLEMKSRNKK